MHHISNVNVGVKGSATGINEYNIGSWSVLYHIVNDEFILLCNVALTL